MLRFSELGLGAAGVALALVACGGSNSVVGGACAEGYVQKGSECVPSSSVSDGGFLGDGDQGDASPRDRDGDTPGDAQTNPADDATSVVSTTTTGPSLVCFDPDILCGNECIDPTSDPNNCGSCGKVCPSNSCVAGKCVGAAPGHVVVIGHDYTTSPSSFSSQARVLSNATLLPASNPLRVMSYEQYADATSVKNAEALVSAAAKQLGRGISFVPTTTSVAVSSGIDVNAYDVLLVHDQKNAPEGVLGAIGSAWQVDGHITAFLHAGGVVIVLSGGGGTGEMPALTTSAQLLAVDAQSTVTGGLSVLAAADAIGTGVVSPYVPKPSTVTFVTEANGGNVVWVVGQNGAPVVVHKVMP